MSKLTRRDLLKGVGLGAAGVAASSALAAGAAADKGDGPGGINVLFLMTDQQTFRALGAAGNKVIRTPNLDRLAAQGVRFELATCPTPYCSPTRASIVTGLYPHANGIMLNVGPRAKAIQKELKEGLFPLTEGILHKRGYYTAHRGKWHLGSKGDLACYKSLPAGLSHSYTGFRYGAFLHKRLPAAKFAQDPGHARAYGRPVHMIPACREGQRKYMAWPRRSRQPISIIGRSVVPAELTPEACFTDQALKMIEQNARRNWMVTVSWSPPHALWVAPEPYYGLHERKRMPAYNDRDKLPQWMRRAVGRKLGDFIGPEGIREYQAVYYAQVAMMDAHVGCLLKKLDELKIADRTLVIFTSDHGDMHGRFGCVGKSIPAFYEEILRIPLLMRLPGKIQPGRVVGQPVSLVDLMPTILDYAGAPCPKGIHGRSLRPLIEGRAANWPEFSFCQRTNPFGKRKNVNRMIRSKQWKYCFYSNGRHQLFDLVGDPMERNNLFGDKSRRPTVRRLHAELRTWMKQTDDPFRKHVPEDPFA